MTLPRFLRARPQPLQALEDDETAPYRAVLGRWLIDLALLLDWSDGRRKSRFPHRACCWDNEEFLDLTGLAETDEDEDEDENGRFRSPRQRLQRLQRLQQRRAELARIDLNPDLPLPRNLELLARLVELSEAEQAVLAFAVLLHGDRPFHQAIAQQSQGASTPLLCKLLARLTGLSPDNIRAALSPTAALLATGLVELMTRHADLEDKLGVRQDLPNLLLAPHADAEALMACFLKRSPRRALTVANFPHLAQDTAAACGLLRAALANKIPGTNLLLYGPPGVGKTEYAAVLAAAVGAELYEVDYADEDGDPLRGEARLRAFNLGQRLLARRDNALLLFDEVEDVFERNPLAELFGDGEGRAIAGKAWINRTLEHNPVPALWLTNHAKAMDGAYLRRFDYSIRFSTPPPSVRIEIARHHLDAWAGEDDWLAHIAACEHLTPAQLERAAKLARHAGNGDLAVNRALVRRALDGSATLLRQKRAPTRNVVPTGYDLRFLNVDQDVPKLIAALQRRPRGIFCFHGPAGTGKSELARHIADRLEKPLLVKRASDLLDMYLGQTEQRIAAMFDEARQRDAVLVLDEADSFLRDRRDAHHSWEVTQVNELLTQMEAFEGIFIATTNLMETLDPASLRRFPWKIRFNWLKPGQRWGLFVQEFARLGGELAEAADYQAEVGRLERLTPGDVAAVVRQYELWDETPSAGEFHRRLAAEVTAKESAGATETARHRSTTAMYG
ncbi:MAG: ATP-binding protein [Candidatus Competibacter sp.]|nr:ATP-binding protein [Candidatus Competibacter sp.]MDG4584400.1 ATP-binding protein [Candidatus Competibacter sp.]